MGKKTIIVDITSLISIPFLSGIQRVVIEYVKRLIVHYSDICIVFYDNKKGSFFLADNKDFYDALVLGGAISDFKPNTKKKFNLDKLNCNYVWFDIDSVWAGNCFPRSKLYPYLKYKKVKIITLIHDLCPIINPKFSNSDMLLDFNLYVASIFCYSDVIFTTSSVVKNECVEVASVLNSKVKITPFLPLGSDIKTNYDISKISNSIINLTNKNKYLLVVGSLEPRKNHKLIFDACSSLNPNFNIIVAGRIDNSNIEIYDEMKKNYLFGKRLFYINEPSNNELVYLYKKAFALIMPSFSEGFGLPVAEALCCGCPVFANSIPVFKEVSNNLAILFDANDKKDFLNKINPYLNNGSAYNNLKRNIKKFKTVNWDESFERLLDNIIHYSN